MRDFKKYFLLNIFLLFMLNSLADCSYFFYVKADGHIDKDVTFSFFKAPEDAKPKSYNVLDFTVQEQKSDSKWVVVWDVQGSQALEIIEYGKKYEGLDELTSAKPLAKKARYRALVSATTWPSSGKGSSGVSFYFDESGRLVQEDLAGDVNK